MWERVYRIESESCGSASVFPGRRKCSPFDYGETASKRLLSMERSDPLCGNLVRWSRVPQSERGRRLRSISPFQRSAVVVHHRLTGSNIEQSGLWVAIDWEKDEEHYVAVTHST